MKSGGDFESDGEIKFGPFRLRPSERVLEKDGQPVRLGGRALEILLTLAEAQGKIVSQKALSARVWPNIYVSDASLRVQVRTLRQALQDGIDGARYVVNIPGRGYCLVPQTTGQASKPKSQATDGTPESLPARDEVRTNLPRPLGGLIGREVELSELEKLINQKRFVTILGPGGVGKSRLAIEVGHKMLDSYPAGVWLVDLAAINDGALTSSAIAAATGAKLQGDEPVAEAIAAAIGKRRILMILDNCEHLIGSIADLAEFLLQRAPGLSVLGTSQEIIGVAAEQVYRLAPLALPPLEVTDVTGYGAVALFCERAGDADSRFDINSENAKTVADICRRLDGIPLALEMAAARVPLLGLEGLRTELTKRLQGSASKLAHSGGRHTTLRSMIEWSYSLLGRELERVFRRLTVFHGSFSLEAAIAVAGGDQVDPWDVIDPLGRLINKSMVVAETSDPPRYRLLETLRQFGLERLNSEQESSLVKERHASYFRRLTDEAYSTWEVLPEDAVAATFGSDIDNIRAALDWSLSDVGRADVAIGLAGAAGPIWETLWLYPEARRYLDLALELIDPQSPNSDVARLYLQSGVFWRYADAPRAKQLLEHCITVSAAIQDPINLASGQGRLASILTNLGRGDEAAQLLSEAMTVFSRFECKTSEIGCLINLGIISLQKNMYADSERYYVRALDIARGLKKYSHVSVLLSFLAGVAFAQGDLQGAIEMGRESVDVLKFNKARTYLGLRLSNLSVFLILGSQLEEARRVCEEALSLQRLEGGLLLLNCLQAYALLLAFEQNFAAAAPIAGYVDHNYARAGVVRQPSEQRTYMALIGMLKARLSDDDLQAAMARGAAWDEDDAVAYALNIATNARDALQLSGLATGEAPIRNVSA